MNWFLLALISAVFSAFAAVSEKKALFSLNPLNFSFLVSLVTLVFSIPFFFAVNPADITSAGMAVLAFKTILSASAFLCVMLSLKNLEVSEALPLLALSPALVAVAGVILINDHLSLLQWTGVAVMVAGAYILELRKGTTNLLEPLKAVLLFSKYRYVFIALFLFMVSSILDRLLLKGFKLPPYTFMAFQQLFYALFFLVIILFKRVSITAGLKEGGRSLLILIAAVSVFTVIYRYTQIEATKLAPVALVLSVKRLSVLFAVIIGGKLFLEDNLKRRILAVIIILAGAALLMNNA